MTEGRTPKAKPTAAERAALTEQRRHRAREELLDVHRKEGAPFLMLEVTNPLRQTHYRVFVPEYPQLATMACVCTDFGHRGLGTCKHLEAAREWLGRTPLVAPDRSSTTGVEAARIWREIDARQASALRDRGPAALRTRRPGAVLFDRPVPF